MEAQMAKFQEPFRRKVPLVMYVDGIRKVIGEAMVTIRDNDFVVIGSTIEDENARELIWPEATQLQVGFSPFS